MHRKTTLTVLAAGGLIAAAAFLGQKKTSGATAPKPNPAPEANACGAPAPARAETDFGYGPLSAALSAARLVQHGNGEAFVTLDMGVRDMPLSKRPPLNLAIVIDHSGSMQGDKIEHARSAAMGVVERLGEADRVALVQYDDTAEVLVPSTKVDAKGKAKLVAAIAGIKLSGSTNLHGGMSLGRDQVLGALSEGGVNRVILVSDGLANVGVVDTPTLTGAAAAAAAQGVRITTIGVGLEYNEDLMEAIAEGGRGQYYYVKDAAALDAVFAGELRSMQATVATHAELRLAPACPGVEVREVFGYASRHEGGKVIVPLADLFGGDKRKIVVRMYVPSEIAGQRNVLNAELAFDDAQTGGRKQHALAVGAEITPDATAAQASIAKEVMTDVVRVESARKMREAAEAYQKGDVARASGILGAQRAYAAKQQADFALPAEATKGVFDELDGMDHGFKQYAPDSEGGGHLVKSSKSKARMLSK